MSTTTSQTELQQLTGEYAIDVSHSRVGFVARHAMVSKVRGAFNDFEGSIVIDGANPANSSARVVIKATSIDTRNEQRDAHIRSNDFLALDEYPEITFVSTSAEQLDETTFRLDGDLTIKGVSRPVSLDLEYTGTAVDPFGNQRVGFEGGVTINRKDFGVTWNAALETGGVLVSEKVNLELEISAIKVG